MITFSKYIDTMIPNPYSIVSHSVFKARGYTAHVHAVHHIHILHGFELIHENPPAWLVIISYNTARNNVSFKDTALIPVCQEFFPAIRL